MVDTVTGLLDCLPKAGVILLPFWCCLVNSPPVRYFYMTYLRMILFIDLIKAISVIFLICLGSPNLKGLVLRPQYNPKNQEGVGTVSEHAAAFMYTIVYCICSGDRMLICHLLPCLIILWKHKCNDSSQCALMHTNRQFSLGAFTGFCFGVIPCRGPTLPFRVGWLDALLPVLLPIQLCTKAFGTIKTDSGIKLGLAQETVCSKALIFIILAVVLAFANILSDCASTNFDEASSIC